MLAVYTKLLDIDKVDLFISAHGTNVTGPALPIVIAHSKTFMGLPSRWTSTRNSTARNTFWVPPARPGPGSDLRGFSRSSRPMNISSALKPSQRWSMTARRRPIIRRRRRPAARRPAHCRLRQDSVADDHRLQSNYSRHSGDQPRNRLICLLPAGQSRPDPLNARERTQYEGVLRYDDWCAERLD